MNEMSDMAGMADVENCLTRALAAEADRHEPPVFNAYRIAESVTRKHSRRLRPVLALAAAAMLGAAGAGGAAVLAAGGEGSKHDLVTVTVQSHTGSVGPQVTDYAVQSSVHSRASVLGMNDVKATVQHNPWRLVVTGHAADRENLESFGRQGILQFRRVAYPSVPPPALGAKRSCEVSIVGFGAAWPACGRDGTGRSRPWSTAPFTTCSMCRDR
jgi:hypothetical protein